MFFSCTKNNYALCYVIRKFVKDYSEMSLIPETIFLHNQVRIPPDPFFAEGG